MRIGIVGSMTNPCTGLFHYHSAVFTRDETCPSRWGRSKVYSIGTPAAIRMGSLCVVCGPTLASVAHLLDEWHAPHPRVLVILAQEPNEAEFKKRIAYGRSEQVFQLVAVDEGFVLEAEATAEGFVVTDRSNEVPATGYAIPAVTPLLVPFKGADAKPPAPKKRKAKEEAPIADAVLPPSEPVAPESLPE
jgi:hypothetical protein